MRKERGPEIIINGRPFEISPSVRNKDGVLIRSERVFPKTVKRPDIKPPFTLHQISTSRGRGN